MIKGLDLNHWRPLRDFSVLVRLEHKFVITKATEGISYLDATLVPNINNANDHGLLSGAYHYLRTTVDPVQQANFYWDKVKGLKMEIPPIIDIEPYSNDTTKLNSYALAFVNRITLLSDKKPIIYTNYNTWNILGKPAWGKDYYLWVASYYVDKPYIPAPWTNYLFWQYTNIEDIGDPTYKFDCNYFNGTENQLRSILGLPPINTVEDRLSVAELQIKKLMGDIATIKGKLGL